MSKRRYARQTTVVAFSLLVALWATGCTDESVEETNTTIADQATGVGAEGGVLQSAEATLTIPAGALSSKVDVAIDEVVPVNRPNAAWPEDVHLVSKVFAFTPHGTTFDAKVTVTLPIEAHQGDLTVVRLDDPSDTDWQSLEATPDFNGDGTVSFQIDSFSYYAVVESTGGSANAAVAEPSDGVEEPEEEEVEEEEEPVEEEEEEPDSEPSSRPGG